MVIFTEQILNGKLHFLMQWMLGCRLGFLVRLILSLSLHLVISLSALVCKTYHNFLKYSDLEMEAKRMKKICLLKGQYLETEKG